MDKNIENFGTATARSNVTNVKEKVRETGEAIAKAAQDFSESTSDKIKESAKEVKKQANDIEEFVINYVQDNPLKAIGIAVLTGLVLSKLLHK